jgi:ParB/RepB/Spo0J family partition protein
MTSAAVPSPGTQVLDLPLDDLQDSPFQVKRYDDARVRDLAETIRKQGLLQPATVRQVDGKYQLISGHGRRAALRYLRDKVATTEAEKARYTTLRCVLLEGIDDARAAALSAIENLQRDDGTPLEQALMLARARTAGNHRSAAEVAEAMGLKERRVRQLLELADAPAVIQKAVDPGLMVPGKEPGNAGQRVPLPVTNALAARGYYTLAFEDALAQLKAKRRLALASGDEGAREAERARIREQAQGAASERTAQFLVRAARGRWSVKQIEKHVRRLIHRRGLETPKQATSAEEEGASESPAPVTLPRSPRLFENRGGRFTLFPQAIAGADAAARHQLAQHLRSFLSALEATAL